MVFHPEIIGPDIEFLVQSTGGSRVWSVGEISEAIEADSYYDEPGRMDEAKIFALHFGSLPRPVEIKYAEPDPKHAAETPAKYKLMQLYSGIELIAQAPIML